MDVVTLGIARADAKRNYAPLPLRQAIYCNGGQGDVTTTTKTETGLRLPIRLFDSTVDFKVRIRNFDSKNNSATAQANLTGKGIILGRHAVSSLGAETGNITTGTAKTLVSGDFAIPGDGSWYETPWITDTDKQLTKGADYVLGLGFVAATSTLFVRGTGMVFETPTAAEGVNPTVAAGSNSASGVPLDIQIVYRTRTRRNVVLFVGDSMTANFGDMVPWYLTWPHLWAARNNALAINLAQSGTTTYDWSLGAAQRWTRTDIAGCAPDAVFVGLGSNDAANQASLGTVQGYMRDTIANARALAPNKPLYLHTVPPRGWATSDAKETNRLALNDWLRTAPLGVTGIVDMDLALRDPAATNTIPAFMTTDNTHMKRAGMNRQAAAAGGIIGA